MRGGAQRCGPWGCRGVKAEPGSRWWRCPAGRVGAAPRPRCPRGAIAASQRRAGAELSHGAACPAPDSRCAGAPPRPDAALRLQEELTSTSVEHLIINPNAAFEKFKDKRLGTDGVGERRPGGGGRGCRGAELDVCPLLQISLTASARAERPAMSPGSMKW